MLLRRRFSECASSPAKVLRSVLATDAFFCHVQKGASNKGYAAAGKEPAFSESSPVISEPVLVSAHNNETAREVAKAENSSVQEEVPVTDVCQDLEKQGAGSDSSNDADRVREEQAAVKAQAAFRGYLVIFVFFFKLSGSSTLTTYAIWLCHVPMLSSTAPSLLRVVHIKMIRQI